MGGREGPEYSPAQQLADLLARLKAGKVERDGKLPPLKQIASDVQRRMKTAAVQGLATDRGKSYSVSHLSGVLRGVAWPSPTLAYYLIGVLGGNQRESWRAVELARSLQDQPRDMRRLPGYSQPVRPLLVPAVDAVLRQLPDQGQRDGRRSVRTAVELALGRAITHYATSSGKAGLAVPLLQPGGFLASAEVAAGLAEVMSSEGPGCAEVVARLWGNALPAGARGRGLTEDASELLGYVRAEARKLAPLRALLPAELQAEWRSKARAFPEVAAGSREQLSRLREELADLAREAAGRSKTALDIPPRIRVQIRDQTALILRSRKGFVGRGFVFSQLSEFIERERSGYCFVLARPGIGKTALLAQLVLNEPGYVRHFNVLTDGVTTPAAFLKNVCAQLIGAYHLPYDELPERAAYDNGFLTELLERSVTANQGGKVVVVVDALDEAQTSGRLPGTNPLYLPRALPDGCAFIVTVRTDAPAWRPHLEPECARDEVTIDERGDENMDDIREFIRSQSAGRGIGRYLASHGFDLDQFTGHLAAKSEGNFMYLHYVLPAIEAGGYLADRDVTDLPTGLTEYYTDQLERMKGIDEEAWFSWKRPVVTALAEADEPLTIREIATAAGARNMARVVAIIREWLQFLDSVPVTRDGRDMRAYRIFHASFQEFLLREVGDAAEMEMMDRLHREARRRFIDDE